MSTALHTLGTPFRRFRRRLPSGFAPGISAILVKELRGRMRGRRAFATITIHLLLVAGIGWMIQRIAEENVIAQSAFGGQVTYAAAGIGRAIFIGMMVLQTIIVAVLAPASTAGTISGERERQTLDLLTVTPISSVAIVLGKMLSALTWVLVLVLASVPVTALVFLFGGVAPDDVVRGYVVVLATAVGLGSVGIFFSALLRRTGAATGLTFVAVLVAMVGSLFIWFFIQATGRDQLTGISRTPPEQILYVNPFVAQADVACGAEGSLGSWCGFISTIVGSNDIQVVPQPDFPVPAKGLDTTGGGAVFIGGVAGGVNGGAVGPIRPADVVPDTIDATRDRFWPKTVATWLVIALVLTVASVQLVTPTRRWRPRLPRIRRPISERRPS